MPGRDLIVVGASAGGVQALIELLRGLPATLPAAVFIVVHTSPTSPGVLPQILQRAGQLPCTNATDNEPIRHGHVYVAPPDHHLLIKPGGDLGTVRIVRGPKENGFRPAVDPLFRTAARVGGARAVGVILSGSLDDGTEGLVLIKACGGAAVVQDPAEAHFPSMPASAIANVDVDEVLPVAQIAPLLMRLATEPLPKKARAMPRDADKPDVAEVADASLLTGDLPVRPSGFTCPECGGALWDLDGGKIIKFRCHVGHSYSADGLVAEQTRELEASLWTALRALEESAELRRRMANRARRGTWATIAEDYERQAQDAEARAALIRKTLMVEDPATATVRADKSPPRPRWDGELYPRSANGSSRNGKAANGKAANGKTPDGKAGNGKTGGNGSNGSSARRRKAPADAAKRAPGSKVTARRRAKA